MSSFDIAGGLRNLKGGPLDTLRGPYVSLTAANLAIPNVLVDGVNFREGKQVDIVDPEGVYVTYWWQQGYEDENLTPVLIKGDKGDPFVYSDFTPEQITDLKQPAIDAAIVANTAANNANDKATLANNAAINADNKASLANTATNNANIATTNADNAATNANNKATLAQTAANNADTATANTNTAISQANTARDNANTAASSANTATSNANTATSVANTATSNANTATSQANDARDEALAAAIVANGARGWQPEYGLESDGAEREVQKLIRWVGGTGSTPIDYVGKYIGSTGFVDTKAEATNIKGKKAIISSTSTTSNTIGTGTKTFILATPMDLVVGQVAKAYSLADPNNYVCGYIFSITPTEIVITVSEIGGSGTKTDWVIALGAFRGNIGISTTNMTTANRLLGLNAGDTVPSSPKQLEPIGLTLSGDKVYNGVERYTNNTVQKVVLVRNIQDGLFRTGNATDVGAIKIALPAYGAGSQPVIKGVIYFYDALLATNRSCEFMITANTGSLGNGASAVFIGANAPKFPVRWYLDADGTTRYIAIGELTQDWSYLSFAITDVLNGLNGATLANSSSGYNISLITAFTGTIHQSRTETLPKPSLSNAVADYVAASGVDTSLTNAMSPVQMFQNLQKQNDNRYTKAQSDNNYPAKPLLGGSSSSIFVNDAGGSNLIPGTNRQKGVWFEFKTSSGIGLTLGSAYSAVTTFVPWNDDTGNNNTAYRLASSAGYLWFQNYVLGAWGSWYRLLDSRGSSANILLGDGTYQALSTLPAFTATKLLTARNINGVAFDGTANITVTDSTKEPTANKSIALTSPDDVKFPTTKAVSDALALKAPIASPTFTGTVSGITKTMVGLGSVNDTPDTAKPVSTAQQTAIDAKVADNLTASTTVAPSKTAVNTALALKAGISSPTFTGTPSLPTGTTGVTQTAGDNSTKLATTAYVKTAVDAVSSSVTLLKGSTTANGTDVKTNFYKDVTLTGASVNDNIIITNDFRRINSTSTGGCKISADVISTNTVRLYFTLLMNANDSAVPVEDPSSTSWTINFAIIK